MCEEGLLQRGRLRLLELGVHLSKCDEEGVTLGETSRAVLGLVGDESLCGDLRVKVRYD